MLSFVRRKRAAESGEDATATTSNNGFYTSQDRITSPDSADTAPHSPRHANKTFPTPSNITVEEANDLCLGAIQTTELYEKCLNFTGNDTVHYVTGCVEDIKVTVFVVCHNVCSIATFSCVHLLTSVVSLMLVFIHHHHHSRLFQTTVHRTLKANEHAKTY